MKRALAIVIVALLFIAGLLWNALRTPDLVILDDGSRLQLIHSQIGGAELAPIRIGFWQALGGAAPGKLQKWLPNMMQPSFSAGGRSMWIEVPDPTNSLQIVFKWEGKTDLAGANQLSAAIRDLNGETWFPFKENVSDITGPDGEIVQVYTFHFAAFPRWQNEWNIVVSRRDGAPNELTNIAEFVAENPTPSVTEETWKTASLPARYRIDPLEVVLEGYQVNATADPRHSPVTWRINSIEPRATPSISNAWHIVKAAVWDNFGNNAINGLPFRTVEDTKSAGHQWRVLLDLVADERSVTASNFFLSLQPNQFPAPGHLVELFSGPTNHFGVSIGAVRLVGAGEMRFANGIFLTNNAAVPPVPGLKRSTSRSTAADGTMTRVLTLKNTSPVLAINVDGASDATWFSCRAVGQESGRVLWLDVRRAPQVDQAQFSRLVNDGQLVYYSMEKLDPEEEWQFTFGVHLIRQVEFFVDRPLAGAAN